MGERISSPRAWTWDQRIKLGDSGDRRRKKKDTQERAQTHMSNWFMLLKDSDAEKIRR